MAQNDTYKCNKCGYEEKRLLPVYVKVSTTPCPRCGGTMIRLYS